MINLSRYFGSRAHNRRTKLVGQSHEDMIDHIYNSFCNRDIGNLRWRRTREEKIITCSYALNFWFRVTRKETRVTGCRY